MLLMYDFKFQIAHYCASISREERPLFVVKLEENDNTDRTKEQKEAHTQSEHAYCQYVLPMQIKEIKVTEKYLFDYTFDNKNRLVDSFKFMNYGL